ncbi:hypothetical protein [Nocardioides pacificus]
MDHDSQCFSPDEFELAVDGMTFMVAYDSEQPGTYHYKRLGGVPGGPALGHGFTERRSDHQRQTTTAHVEAIREWAEGLDPLFRVLRTPEVLGQWNKQPRSALL